MQFIEELKEWRQQENHDDIKFLRDKVKRLKDKERTTLKEIEGRKLGHFKRKPHGTIYYIDLDAGNDALTGLSIAQNWLTLAKYTTTTVRTPGDIAKVRAATDELMAVDLVFDEDGDQDDYIEIRGCSIADDPWSDGSDVKPILTFGDASKNATPNGDNYWKINRLIIKESADGDGNIYLRNVFGWYLLDSEFTDNNRANGMGVRTAFCNNIKFENCIFKDNKGYNIYVGEYSYAQLVNCTLDGGVVTTDYGIYAYGGIVECIDCDLGQTTDHDIDDVYTVYRGMVTLRNCKLGTAGITVASLGNPVYEEDVDGSYGAYRQTHQHGVIIRSVLVMTGSATFSMKLNPNALCGPNNPLTLHDDSLISFPFNLLCTAGVEKTVTIKLRSIAAWAAYPTATELYIKFAYLSNAVSAARTQIASTQVLSHASNWVDFTVTFTPLQTGIAYGGAYLHKYELNQGCYVNMEAT